MATFNQVDAVMRRGLGTVFPTAVLLIKHQGETVYHRAYGWLDPDVERRPTQVDSVFDLASLTKLFTATAFMTLVEAGVVELETAVSTIIPPFAHPSVTFRHLLTHTAGLPATCNLYRNNAYANPLDALYDRLELAPAGRQCVYSDVGLILLGEAVARLMGKPLSVYMKEAIFEPLSLHETGFNPLERGISIDRIVPTELCAWRRRRCVGEVHDENAFALGGESGHAGLFATAQEVAALGQLYLNGGRHDAGRLFSPSLAAEAVREQVKLDNGRYGLGWMLQRESGSPIGQAFGMNSYGHTGFTGTSLWIDPDQEMLVVLLTNRVYYGRKPHQIVAFRARLHDTAMADVR